MEETKLPKEVVQLFRREREIAELVYAHGSATAKDIESLVSVPLSNAATRSMLNRLVTKGIVTRQRKEDSLEYVYSPALSTELSREKALEQLAEDFFGGSLPELASAVARLAKRSTS